MSSITVRYDDYFRTSLDENGFTVWLDEDGARKEYLGETGKYIANLIPPDEYERCWNKFLEINFSKVLMEQCERAVSDGWFLKVELQNGEKSLCVQLGNPGFEEYREAGAEESLKMLEAVRDVCVMAGEEEVVERIGEKIKPAYMKI